MARLRRTVPGVLMIVSVCLALTTSSRAAAASMTGTIDVASGKVSIQGTAEPGAVVAINGRQFRTSSTGMFSGSLPGAASAVIAVVGQNRPGFSLLLTMPLIPLAAVHVLPAISFTYDDATRALGLGGKLIRKPAGAVRGYVSGGGTRATSSFAVGRDNRFSTTIRLGTGPNTLHSYVRYLLVMRYTLPDFVVTVGPAPRVILSLAIGSSQMTVNGLTKSIDGQGTRPLIVKGTTMVPIRAIIESLGGSVAWDATARRLDIRLGTRTVTMFAGKTTAVLNGRSTTLSTAPVISGGRTMVPLRFVAESLGCLVGWDQATRGVTIVYGG